MADINFPITETIAPETAQAGTVVYTTGVDTEGKILLNDSNLRVDADGNFLNTVMFDSIIDVSIKGTTQVINSADVTHVDLKLGHSVKLSLQSNAMIQFSNLPPAGHVKFINFFVTHDSTGNAYSLGFNHPTKTEGKQGIVMTEFADAKDMILARIDSGGNVKVRGVIKDFLLKSAPGKVGVIDYAALAVVNQANQANEEANMQPFNATPTPNVDGIVPGAILTAMADGTLNATGVVCDGYNSITGQVQLVNASISDITFAETTLTSVGGVLTIDCSLGNIFKLNHVEDITSIVLLNNNIDLADIFVITRIKDNNETPRNIFFDPALFSWEAEPILTQTALGEDEIIIQSAIGANILTVLNNF